MADNKDQALATFQDCTGIIDVDEALAILESCDWNLMAAIHNAMPNQSSELRQISRPEPQLPDSPVLRYTSLFPSTDDSAEVIEIDTPSEEGSLTSLATVIASASSAFEPPSTSSGITRTNPATLDINIEVLCGGASEGSSFPLEVPGSSTVRGLKTMLFQLVGIPPCHQMLEGFVKPLDDNAVLTPDVLPKSKTLTLNTGSSSVIDNPYERLNGAHSNYHLLIHDENSKRDYSLNYPASKPIQDLKLDIFHMTNIAVRHQLWTGWPPNLDENATLGSSGISKEHHLTVSQQPSTTPKAAKKVVESVADDSSGDEFEDASDLLPDYFMDMVDVPSSQRQQSLIPPNTEDETIGVTHFCEQFHERYGNCIPVFHQNTLESALKESVMLPAKNRKLLAVYLHHDNSVLSNVFCSESLCQLSVVDFLNANFIVWGWDLTHASNKSRLLNLVSLHFGTVASSTVRSFSNDKLPALLIITRSRGTIEVLTVIHGNSVLDEVMTSLIHAVELFENQRRGEVSEEEAREEREAMKAEQDAAYHQSLAMDRAKEEKKRVAELQEKVERERQQSIKEQEEAYKTAVRASLEESLPPEPEPESTEPVTRLRFRIGNTDGFTRSFTLATQLQVVLNYLCVKGYAADEYKCIQSWPRRDVTNLDASLTLEELKFPQQETLNIEER